MLNYHISPRELLELSPETVETLFAGLVWWRLVNVSTPVDEGKRQSEAWNRLGALIGV